MDQAKIAQRAPYPVTIEAGKSYCWCSCGQSAKQPFYYGSHKGTNFQPEEYDAIESKAVCFCGCKSSKNIFPATRQTKN